MMEVYSTNPFHKIVSDNFLIFEDMGVLDANMQYSFSLFNIFNCNTVLKHSILLDKNIKTKDIVIRVNGLDKELFFDYKNVAMKDSYIKEDKD